MDWDPALDCEIQEDESKSAKRSTSAQISFKEPSNQTSNSHGFKDLLKLLSTETPDVVAVQNALDARINPNEHEHLTGQTALLRAVRGQHYAIARHLLQAQALA